MVAVHDVFIHLSTTIHVIRLNGEHFLQGVCCAVCFQRPHFHLPEALTTELSLTTQRLLSNQAVRTGRTSVHLVVDQVVQFQHVHVTYGYRTLELFTGTAVKQRNLTRRWQTTQLQQLFNFSFFCTVEYRRCNWHTLTQVFRQTQNFIIAEGV